jgi:hypothetical protein
MKLVNKWVLSLTVGCFVGAQAITEDPVMKARLQRAQAQGIEESDLPPVPRSVMEPPPLPPPEIHSKDLPHSRVSRSGRHRGARTAQAGKGAQARGGRHARPAPEPRQARKRARSTDKVSRKASLRIKA